MSREKWPAGYSETLLHTRSSMSPVISTEPSSWSRADRYWNFTSMLDTPSGTSTLNAYTSYLSRIHFSGLPFAVITSPASLSMGPLGEWLPGIHFGYSRVSSPAATGMVSCTRKMPWLVSLASTAILMVPAYGVSCGGGTCASAASANAVPANGAVSNSAASAAAKREGRGWNALGFDIGVLLVTSSRQ